MSFQRTTESWNNNPNNFSNPHGPNVGLNRSGNEPSEGARPTHDPTDTSTWETDATGRRQGERQWERSDVGNRGAQEGNLWTAGAGDNYGNTAMPGDRTDANTVGAGANAFGQSGFREGDNWHNTGAAGGKPSTTEKLKDTVENLTDKLRPSH